MRCEYRDGMKVNYTGPLQITRGNDINVFISEGRLTPAMKDDLEMALFRNSCTSFKEVADEAMKSYGNRACIH